MTQSLPPSPPTISVLMPVYNAQRYVAQAVESILNQSFGDFEFLIIDDGSTDRSLKILQRYANQDPRIRLISRPNTGYVKALNELLALAQGEFLARMDADDVAMPNRFAQQVKFLRQHPEVLCVGGAQDWIDDAGRFLLHHPEAETDAEIQQLALSGQTPINHPSAMMRRTAVLQVGGYDEALHPSEDLDLWLKLGEIGQLANLPETVLQYRQHDRSVSERLQTLQTEQRRRCCERAWERRGITGSFHESEPWRPIDPPSRLRFMTMYGWWFFHAGKRNAAIIYGLKAIRALPTAVDGWKLLACALLKPMPAPESKGG
ncbi:MAG: glycosyltransferase [Synechococcales cyanobacterium C42_A2020_086]|nr:glycosyltransferase [Synechococcales cyanobacterium C42_A2020_086]